MPVSLVDTNVLVYAVDPRDHMKQLRAMEVLDTLIASQQAILSVQSLTEFFVTVTRRLRDPMPIADALAQVEQLSLTCEVVDLTPAIALEGLRGSTRHQLPPWDGLIWAAAKLNQIPYVLTEDAPHGKVLEGVHYLNPFAADFDPRVLV